MAQSRFTYLFNRYINKEYTAEEKAELFRLIETADADEELKALLENLVDSTGAELSLSENAGDKILQSITGDISATSVTTAVHARRIKPVWAAVAAASVIFLVLFGYLTGGRDKTEKSAPEIIAAKAAGSKLLQASTPTGEGRNIQLADGTQVWLSPSSSLEYPAAFTGALREVRLSGEAFFEVAHDKEHPFIIQSGNIETKVLGTSFNIQAYDNQEEINVTVVTGKVNVTNKTKVENVELVANQRAVFHRKTTALVKEAENIAAAPAMLKRKEGEFVFNNQKLGKLADDLREYFGVDIIVPDSLKECNVTISFSIGETIEGVLEPLAVMIDGNFQKKGNAFLINGKLCSTGDSK